MMSIGRIGDSANDGVRPRHGQLSAADHKLVRAIGGMDDGLEDCSVVSLCAGDELIGPAALSSNMYLVLSGTLEVRLQSATGTLIDTLGQGEVVGELSLLDGQPASALVICSRDSRVLVVGPETFWIWAANSHSFCMCLMLKLAHRLRRTNTTVKDHVVMRERFEREALYDALTSVYNRRWLDETLPRVLQRQQHLGQPLSVALVDVDHFKSVNDTHGHATGDAVLVSLVHHMRQHLRPTDMLARYGGEEFVVILPDADGSGAFCAAERLRVGIQSAPLAVDEPCGPLLLTVSIGVATLEPGMQYAQLLADADAHLYRAKDAGRNRTLPRPKSSPCA